MWLRFTIAAQNAKLTVNGFVGSSNTAIVAANIGNTIIIGTNGTVSGDVGIDSSSAGSTIVNHGKIYATTTAIQSRDGNFNFDSYGLISADLGIQKNSDGTYVNQKGGAILGHTPVQFNGNPSVEESQQCRHM